MAALTSRGGGQPLNLVVSRHMQIRAANPSDARAIAELHAASWRYAYREALSDAYLAGDVASERQHFWEARLLQPSRNQHVLLAHVDSVLAGFVCVYGAEHQEWGYLSVMRQSGLYEMWSRGGCTNDSFRPQPVIAPRPPKQSLTGNGGPRAVIQSLKSVRRIIGRMTEVNEMIR